MDTRLRLIKRKAKPPVDVEAPDLSGLRSNDWPKYRFRLVAVAEVRPQAQNPVGGCLTLHGCQPAITAKLTRFQTPVTQSPGESANQKISMHKGEQRRTCPADHPLPYY